MNNIKLYLDENNSLICETPDESFLKTTFSELASSLIEDIHVQFTSDFHKINLSGEKFEINIKEEEKDLTMVLNKFSNEPKPKAVNITRELFNKGHDLLRERVEQEKYFNLCASFGLYDSPKTVSRIEIRFYDSEKYSKYKLFLIFLTYCFEIMIDEQEHSGPNKILPKSTELIEKYLSE